MKLIKTLSNLEWNTMPSFSLFTNTQRQERKKKKKNEEKTASKNVSFPYERVFRHQTGPNEVDAFIMPSKDKTTLGHLS